MTPTTTYSTESLILAFRGMAEVSIGTLRIIYEQAADKLQHLHDIETGGVSRDYYREYLRYSESEPANEAAPTGGPDAA